MNFGTDSIKISEEFTSKNVFFRYQVERECLKSQQKSNPPTYTFVALPADLQYHVRVYLWAGIAQSPRTPDMWISPLFVRLFTSELHTLKNSTPND